jgi:hypothetical protein
MSDEMMFEDALMSLKRGHKVARHGWNLNKMRADINRREDTSLKPMYVQMQVPDEHSKMGKPYLYIVPSEDSRVPWHPSNADLFADDWYVLD